ncbi:MAG: CTP synthase, partial [Patescibacteria group bacterium]|nr:CTP synthase [Patescibacteria group bacterium]
MDAGTMRPTEHGEVFVGDDGIEADQDLGTYERFIDQASTRNHYITTGQVYQEVIRRERNLEYKGEDVEVVPDIPNEILRRISMTVKKDKSDFVIVEIGGTVGEYQNILFLEAARMMKLKHKENVLFALVSYLPIPPMVGEMKSKPTQYAARTLNGAGIQPDFIICRSERPLDKKRREKIATFCNVTPDAAISAPDVESVYDVPVNFSKEKLDEKILKAFGLKPRSRDMKEWRALAKKIKRLKREVKIAVVGKYFGTGDFELADSYISVIEAAKHACWDAGVKPNFTWVDSEEYERDPKKAKELSRFDGVIVPGGFGTRGIEGIIAAIKHVRTHNIPYLGLCYGMQLASIEFARHVAKIRGATTAEMDPNASHR